MSIFCIEDRNFSFLAQVLAGLIVFSGPQLLLADSDSLSSTETSKYEEEFQAEAFLFGAAPVISTAARHEQSILESPSAISSISADFIKMSGIFEFTDLLRIVPGLKVASVVSSYSVLRFRGSGEKSSSNDLSLFLIDGRPATIEFFPATFTNNLPISNEDIQSIEVIRGPAGALYGANAHTGVISIITKPPEDRVNVWGLVQAGRDGREGPGGWGPLDFGKASLGTRGTIGRFGYTVSAGAEREQDWVYPDRLSHRVVRWRGTLLTPAGPGEVCVDVGGVDAEGDIGIDIFTFHYNLVENYIRGEYSAGGLKTALLLDRLSSKLPVNMSIFGTSINFGDIGGDISLGDLSTEYRWEPVSWSRTILGGDVRATYYDFPIMLKEWQGIPLDRDLHGGLFLQQEFQILENLILTFGGREDWFLVTPQSPSGRAALVYLPWKGHAFRASVARAFRRPSFLESQALVDPSQISDRDTRGLFNGIIGKGNSLGNPHLINMKVAADELGYRYQPNPRIAFDLEFFHQEYWDTIRAAFWPKKNLQPGEKPISLTFWNDPDVVAQNGLEVSLEGKPLQFLTVLLGYYERRERLDPPMERIFNAGAQLKLPPGLSFNVMTQTLSKMNGEVTDPTVNITQVLSGGAVLRPVTYGGNTLVNIALWYEFLNGRAEVGVAGYNLWDAVTGKHHREEEGFIAADGTILGAEPVPPRYSLLCRIRF